MPAGLSACCAFISFLLNEPLRRLPQIIKTLDMEKLLLEDATFAI
jgi:hypothetical protein